jgi:tetratricopeptide (TPR) repeat protein
MKPLALFVSLWLCASTLAFAAESLTIVKDGQPRAEIVVAEQPPRMTKLAAKDLQSYVEKISGASLPIVTKPSGGNTRPIYVGRSSFTDQLQISDTGLEHGAFRIVARGDLLVLLGHDVDFTPLPPHNRHNGDIARATAEWDKLTGATWGLPHVQLYKSYGHELGIWEQDERGSFHAVSELLRRLGVRWFMPGEIGEVVPRRTTIEVPSSDETIRPDFALRYPYQYFKRFSMTSVDEIMWQLRLGFSQAPEVIGLAELGHGTRTVHERPEFRAANPDCFALFGGKRETAGSFGSGKPCLSSPKLFEENVRFAQKVFDIYHEPMISVMPEDGYVSLCQCELCRNRGTPERGWNGQISDYVWDYTQRVAMELMKTHPDRKILCLAYGAYQAPPTKIEKLSPNIVVGITQSRAAFHEPAERKLHDDLRAAWLQKSSNPLVIWEYYLASRPGHVYESLPMFFTRQIDTDLKSLKGKAYGEFIEVNRDWEGLKTLAINHLNLYLTSRYWWQADQSLDSLLNDYCDKFYGPAAVEMRAFIDFGELNWMLMRKQPDKIDEAFALLAKAEAKAVNDSQVSKRIAVIADYVAPMRQLRDQLARQRKNVPHVQILTNDGKPITVDGKLDDELWQRTGGAFGLAELQTGRQPVWGTTFKAAWQKDSLVMAITCREHDPGRFAKLTKDLDNSAIWNGDVIELLIETQANSYYQIAISPSGSVTDLDRKDGKLNTLWKSSIEVATGRDEQSWTIELRLPISDEQQAVLNPLDGLAGRMPSVTYPWHINVCRQRIGAQGAELSALSPTGEDNFHATDKFAILNLKAGGPNQNNPSLDPNFNDGYVLQRREGIELLKAGKYDEALARFKQLATGKVTPLQQADALHQALECAVRLKLIDETQALVKQIKLPNDAKLAQMRLCYHERKMPLLLQQYQDEDWAQWPDTLRGDAAFFRGLAFLSAKNGARAAADFQEAATWTTDDNLRGEALLNWGHVVSQLLHDDVRAIEILRRVYQTRNEFKQSNAAISIADILLAQGKRAEAIAELNRIDMSKITIEHYRSLLLKAKERAAKP